MYPETVSVQTTTSFNRYLAGIFGWMIVAMGVSGIAALMIYSSTSLQEIIFGNAITYYGLIIAELALVFYISARIHKLTSVKAFLLFLTYAFLTGLTLSVILLAYAPKMIVGSFFMAAAVYGIMAIIGYTTKINLSRFGTFLMMSVVGLIVASVANIFLKLEGLGLILSYATLIIFSGLTAYDMQRIKENYAAGHSGGALMIGDALSMYLNFLNIFLSILNIVDRD